jgi:type II secretory pathway component PulL
MPAEKSILSDARKLLAFGSGIGIEIRGDDLEVAVTRVRPGRIQVLGRLAIANYAGRPATEWGAEYTRFIRGAGVGNLSATVLLPRREVIVRQVSLPGVAAKEIDGAIRFQLDSLHPYGEDEISWGWSPLAYGAVLVGIARRATVRRYLDRFAEAGIKVASFTFSAAAVHAAIRLNGAGARLTGGFVALSRSASGGVEVYGESQTRPVFTAEFDLAPPRASALALSELRLPPETTPLPLEDVLPKPASNPVENDLSRNALPYATALAGACPWLAPAANVLAPEQRQASSRRVFIPTILLAAVVLLAVAAVFAYSKYAEHRYLRKLQAEIAALTPVARHADDLDRQIQETRARIQLLDQFRAQTHADLDAIDELTKIIQPPAWLGNITLAHDSVTLAGEAPQAASLVTILDSSPLFQNSTPEVVTRSGNGAESFRIRTARKYPIQ